MVFIRIFSLSFFVVATVVQSGAATSCSKNRGRPSFCAPKFINAAYMKDISANDTCGMKNASLYCVQSRFDVDRVCKTCNAKVPSQAHPPNYMNDRSLGTWWQSSSLFVNIYPVRIVLDLGKTFDVTYIKLVFRSSRPHSFAIYKKSSTDKDAKWAPFQYYSRECRKVYGVQPHQVISRANKKVALCSERFSEITPLSNGNVVFSTIFRRPDQFRFYRSRALQVLALLHHGF